MRIYLLMRVLAIFCCLSANVKAHQQKETVTTLLFNERSGNLEITHRFTLHDAEHAAKRLLDPHADLIGDSTAQRAFGRYVEERFVIRNAKKTALKLVYVGHEMEGKFFWVYQEVPLPEDIVALEVLHDVLRDIWPSQKNLVNIEKAGEVRSLEFKDDVAWLTVKL